ncbi:MAG TPA: DUF1501 domain-containing protein [Rhizomicrobium sp.]|jgi:uncharacterized protein (DUF1501 family)|nr:DUF1501 domain-containing protein [Rhizomicrobium sp.]
MFDRRRILQASLAATALSVAGVRVSFASPATDKRLVVVILRGALDGLTAVPPVGDPDYASVRGKLAIARGDAHPLDATFALHPTLATMHTMWSAKELAVFHCIASPYRDRSHFDAQAVLETGGTSPHGHNDGWLNRALPAAGLDDGTRALAVADTTPLILLGKARTTSWMPATMPSVDEDFLSRVRALYAHDPQLGNALGEALKTEAAMQGTMSSSAPPAAPMQTQSGMDADPLADPNMNGDGKPKPQYANAKASLALLGAGAGKLLASPDGPRVAVLDFSGWDTHVGEGAADGILARRLAALDAALAALKHSLGPAWKDTAVVMATEFGRTVAPNGAGGTDHGTGTVAFLMGGTVAGGKVHAQWDGLKVGSLYQARDLPPRTDVRALFKGALADHLRLPRTAIEGTVFPDSGTVAPMSGLFTA